MPERTSPIMQPEFSIIVPTFNRPTQLAACLTALARLDYPRDRFEVVVVDDGSEKSRRMRSSRLSTADSTSDSIGK